MAKLTRKQFLAATASAAIPAPSAAQSASPAPAFSAPNVLILLSDQHRWDLMTCAGNELVPTPNIDRIAARGVRFTNAQCPYPVCVGSRMSFLSGLYTHNHGAVSNEHTLDWRTPTIASHFASQGYISALIGKMHLNHAFLHGFNYHLSANDWLMYLGPKVQLFANDIASHQHNDFFFKTVNDHGSCFPELPELWGRNQSPWMGKVEHNPHVASALDAEDHIDTFVARETARFLSRSKDQPFFLVAGFLKPHPPFHPPREYAARYPVEKLKLPAAGDPARYPEHIQRRIRNIQARGEERLLSGYAGYLGNLAHLDDCVGTVWQALEANSLLDNTIVVYASDHGDMLGQNGLWQKFVLYEPSINVPLIVSWPKRLAQGQISPALIDYMGLWPTLAELCGHAMPARIDAQSFAAQCRNPKARGPEARFAEYNLTGPVPFYTVRTDQWKYIHNEGQTDELYDLATDPAETRNLAANPRHAAIRRQLRERLFDWYNPDRNPFRPPPA